MFESGYQYIGLVMDDASGIKDVDVIEERESCLMHYSMKQDTLVPITLSTL